MCVLLQIIPRCPKCPQDGSCFSIMKPGILSLPNININSLSFFSLTLQHAFLPIIPSNALFFTKGFKDVIPKVAKISLRNVVTYVIICQMCNDYLVVEKCAMQSHRHRLFQTL